MNTDPYLGAVDPDPYMYNYVQLFFSSLKIDNITLDPDPNWANILDPCPNSMYLAPQH